MTFFLEGIVDTDYTLEADKEWVLNAQLTVGNGNREILSNEEMATIIEDGVTLTIEPGVHIRAAENSWLLVTRGSKLVAEGNEDQPIIFSSLDLDLEDAGEWGGIVLQGFAPYYQQGGLGPCWNEGESFCNVATFFVDDENFFGGQLNNDNSGSLRYVQIIEAGGKADRTGQRFSSLNLQSVGNETDIEFVHIHSALLDGLEISGGAVNPKHLVFTNIEDDDIDFDYGYRGNTQFALIIKDDTKTTPTLGFDSVAIQGNSSDNNYVPETSVSFANMTIIGGLINNEPFNEQPGVRFSGAMAANMYNSVVNNFERGCFQIRDADVTDPTGGTGSIIPTNVFLTNILTGCECGAYAGRAASLEDNVNETFIGFDSSVALTSPLSRVDPIEFTAVDNESEFVFEQTDYIGAVAPGTSPEEAWWANWTVPGVIETAIHRLITPEEADFITCDEVNRTCVVTGDIIQDYTFISGYTWVLSAFHKVGSGSVEIQTNEEMDEIRSNGVTLTVEPGVNVVALPEDALLITRGSKLHAEGLPYLPITFSSRDENFEGEGEWGGIIIQGFAPQYR